MARKKAEPEPAVMPDAPIGPLLAKNLKRLGYVEEVVRVSEVAKKIKATTGRKFTRQRISQLLNAVRVDFDTLDAVAKGLGVKVADLLRED